MDRRKILRYMAMVGLGVITGTRLGFAACPTTATNPKGPFYLHGAPFTDELNVKEEPGLQLVASGRAFSSRICKPLPNAILDVWHANAEGFYYGLESRSLKQLSHGLLRARVWCGDDGGYSFRTILPGHYKLTPTRFRPRYIHVKVSAPEHAEIITQLYFPGDEPLAADPLASGELVMDVSESKDGMSAKFDFYL